MSPWIHRLLSLQNCCGILSVLLISNVSEGNNHEPGVKLAYPKTSGTFYLTTRHNMAANAPSFNRVRLDVACESCCDMLHITVHEVLLFCIKSYKKIVWSSMQMLAPLYVGQSGLVCVPRLPQSQVTDIRQSQHDCVEDHQENMSKVQTGPPRRHAL